MAKVPIDRKGLDMELWYLVSFVVNLVLALVTSLKIKLTLSKRDQTYTIERCTELLGMAHKKEESPIDSDPAIESFNYGKNNQGYWRSENIAIQFEDVCDCLKAMVATKNIHFILWR